MARKPKKIIENIFAKLSPKGGEILDPTPVARQVGRKPSTAADRMREIIRSENLAREMAAQGMETFDEADDFDIPDDPIDPTTPYEEIFDGNVLEDAYRLATSRQPQRTEAPRDPEHPETVKASGNSLRALAAALNELVKRDKTD